MDAVLVAIKPAHWKIVRRQLVLHWDHMALPGRLNRDILRVTSVAFRRSRPLNLLLLRVGSLLWLSQSLLLALADSTNAHIVIDPVLVRVDDELALIVKLLIERLVMVKHLHVVQITFVKETNVSLAGLWLVEVSLTAHVDALLCPLRLRSHVDRQVGVVSFLVTVAHLFLHLLVVSWV